MSLMSSIQFGCLGNASLYTLYKVVICDVIYEYIYFMLICHQQQFVIIFGNRRQKIKINIK